MTTSNYQDKFNQLMQYIQAHRARESSNSCNTNIMIAIESDKGRIINSASFRRLQQKAQVFSLESNAAVRTRLTHTFEVAQIGRYLSQTILNLFKEKNVDISYEQAFSFTTIVENACLLHDLGNPPFGHLGEFAIQKKLASIIEEEKQEIIESNEQKALKELRKFDGNAQALRLVCFLNGSDEYGLNLTYSTLLSMVKYPNLILKSEKNKGIYKKDYEFSYEKACKALNWDKGKLFPFAFLMDMADDIAYSMSDIEDGIEKNVISKYDINELVKDINSLIQTINDPEYPLLSEFKENEQGGHLLYFFIQKIKTVIINVCVKKVAQLFFENIDNVLQGNYDFKEDKSNIFPQVLDKVKKFSREKIYSHNSVEKIELAGDKILKGLIDIYIPLLKLEQEDFNYLINKEFKKIKEKNLHYEARLCNTIPNNYKVKYKKALEFFGNNKEYEEFNDEQNLRYHMLIDYISGMTDDFALQQYTLLSGYVI